LSSSIIRRLPAAGLIVAALGIAGCSQEKAAPVAEVIRPVKVVEIGEAQTTRQLDYSGSVRARTDMNLGFRIAGKVTERLVDIGQHVNAGDVLARVDPSDYELSVKSAQASLDAAERQVETVDLAKKRAEQLYAKNFAPKSQLDQAVLTYDQAVASRDAARSTLAQAQNQVQYADLKASKNGIVTAISADVGQVVAAGTPVMTVAVDGEKEVLIAVPEMDIAGFRPGKSHTFPVRVSLPNDPRGLLGMTANVQATVGSKAQLVSIPLTAMAQKDGKQIVWTVDRASDTVHPRPIKVANFTADGVAVADGLKQGDVVVAAGTQFMTENLKVKLSGDAQQSASADDDVVTTSSLR